MPAQMSAYEDCIDPGSIKEIVELNRVALVRLSNKLSLGKALDNHSIVLFAVISKRPSTTIGGALKDIEWPQNN